MRAIIRNSIIAGAVLLAACGQQAEAPLDGAWTLDPAQSRVAFTTVKAGEIAEAHGFRTLSGSVGADGAATLAIDLASVSTNVDIRNERMREFLFETGAYPVATVTAQLDPAAFSALKVGESKLQPVEATLDLHGVKSPVEAELAVTRIAGGEVKVETAAPIIVDAGTYGLTEGVAKLQELAGLPGITPQVPVSVSLVFAKAE
jgi:polyisoprenoid-binding protein YceI